MTFRKQLKTLPKLKYWWWKLMEHNDISWKMPNKFNKIMRRRGEDYKKKRWTNGGEGEKKGEWWWRKEYGLSWPVWRRRRKKRHRKTAPNLIVTSIHFAFHQSSSCKVSSTLSFVKFYVFICEYVHFFYSHLQHIIRKVNWKKNKNIKLRESNQKREGYQQFPSYIHTHMHTRKEEKKMTKSK